jgi:8-oxo-dGTP diphosphatase
LSREVRAAGGLVVRDGRVLLEHRPRYDDWSLPKGKLEPGEGWQAAAAREVQEETGVRVHIGEELAPVHYTDNKGRPKTVRYWLMNAAGDEPFAPNDEVDEIAWLAPEEAIARLSYPHDRDLVTAWSRRGVEVERKFLVDRRPGELDDAPRRRLSQGYLVTGDVEVRLRRADDETFLTIKAGAGLVRAEEEMPIDADRFDRLWPLTEGRRIEKVRHLVAHGGRTIEVDVYGGAHEGLVVAEVEFPHEDEARAWAPPDWLGADVTGDPAYSNAQLAS